MASIPLTESRSRTQFFRQSAVNNLRYWQTWLETNPDDMTILDRERNAIAKALSFGVKLDEAWPLVLSLVQTLSSVMERRGHWDTWYWVLTRALDAAHRVRDAAAQVTLAALLARLLYRQSRFRESTAYYRQAIRIARQIGDRFGEARACTNLGYFYIEKGHSYRAELLCCHALHLFEQLDNDHGRAHTENHLGILYTWQGLWDKARRHLEQACAIWQARCDHHGLMYGFMNLGLLYVEMERPVEALAYSEKALDQARVAGEELEIAKIYLNMGLAYKLGGHLTEAKRYTRQAESVFRGFYNLPGIADALENLGAIYLEQQQWSQAIDYLENALHRWRTLGNKPDQIKTIILLARSELARKNQEGAALWLKEAENQLRRHTQAGRYYRLHREVDKLRRSLTELATQQAAAS